MKFDAKHLKEMSNAVRAYALRAVHRAGTGHVGIVLGAADIVTIIYANFLRRGRDRFVLSAGHGSALLYSVLKLAGYDVGDLDSFRQLGGLPGHPEYGIDGVMATTGPLGQGVGNAVGMALAAKICGRDENVYCLASDGDLMEGVAAESITFAGRNKLNNLILLWDDNGVSIDGVAQTDIDVPMRMRAAGWRVVSADGDDFNRLERVLNDAPRHDAPTFVRCRDIIGRGSSLAGSNKAHGYALADGEFDKLVEKFTSPVGEDLWAVVAADASAKYVAAPLDACPNKVPDVRATRDISTRELSGMFLRNLMECGARLVGGSADLAGSTNVKTEFHHDISPDVGWQGNFINYGVREHGMAAIMNGLALGGVRPYGSTFLVFSDYMRPSIRLAAMSGLPVIYVFTHDSVAVGADGPTHQPVEQLPSLRLIPNLNVFRPCNGAEVSFAWRRAILDSTHPTCIILSRQKIEMIETPRGADIARGAYIIRPATGRRVRATIIATGAEVPLAVHVAEKLGAGVQVVSMSSVADFRRQANSYRDEILRGFVIAIEASSSAPWFEFADAVIGIDTFGVSGDGGAVYRHMGFDVDKIVAEISQYVRVKK